MRVSIITVSLNSASTIRDTIESVLAQDHPDLEHIIVDGASTDGTAAIATGYGPRIAKVVSEPDRGIYDAMNKGIALATGDIVGILNSDDVYAHSAVVSRVASTFERTATECTFADLVYVSRNNLDKVVRYYSSASFHPARFSQGWMPAHPTVFLRRSAYERFGIFKTDYRIAADYELLVRFLAKHRLSYSYIPEVQVKMRRGGVSTGGLKSSWILNQEIVRACRDNGIRTNTLKVMTRYVAKILGWIPPSSASMLARRSVLERPSQTGETTP